ncbi:MAG: T9SS type A sorting domain-containing protein [Bacteroidales bacterium]|jgi:hypothetical protein|nr:T9SS type A sorting domain-containing protein [Bacteroidales bacterium]
MKRFFIIALGMIVCAITYSQQAIQNWTENFDGTVSFSAKGVGLWSSINHASPSSLPKSYLGQIPNTVGDTNILETITFDCGIYNYVYLRFDHICMVSPDDIVKIQYRTSMGGGMGAWDSLPITAYQGKANNFNPKGVFNNASYSDWNTLSMPPYQNSQWKEESFDLSVEAQRATIQFRFLIIHGTKDGSQANFGWLIDNFRLDASVYEVYPPAIEWISPVQGTVYKTGPYEIKAKVATRTSHPIVQPYLVYTVTGNSVSVLDSMLMTNVAGDSIWTGTFPQFPAGTTVSYSITGTDAIGNNKTISESYTVAIPPASGLSSFVEVSGATSATSCWTPTCHCDPYAWTRNLYLSSDLGTTTTGAMIVAIEWQSSATSGSLTLNNQKCFLEGTTNTTVVPGYIDPVSISATHVLDGTFTIVPGWSRFDFIQPFYLSAGKNLQIHWENLHGTTPGGFTFLHHSTSYNSVADAHTTSSAADIYSLPGNPHTDRPNARFHFMNIIYAHSVALHAIDVSDTIAVSPTTMVPLKVVIKNKGRQDLNLATIKYTINGGTEYSYPWTKTGGLPWDMNDTVKLIDYPPTVNGADIIKVWIELPNGQTDSMEIDNTLTKVVHGTTDISMMFVDAPSDTVRSTGPFAISARISSLTGVTIGPVFLKVATIYGGVPTIDSLLMTFDAPNNLWRTTIPQTQYGSDISYSITMTDIVGNLIVIAKDFYLRRSSSSGQELSSVALVGIESPSISVAASQMEPVRVRIVNKGIDNLTKCTVEWTIDDVPQQPYTWTGNLPEEFTDTIRLGYYTATQLGQLDTIVVWVKNPNDVDDAVKTDDTASVKILGCSGNLSGNQIVGTGGTFTSMANAITAIKECALTGDLILQLKGTYTESIDLTGLTAYTRGHRLTITSLDNNADSVIIQPSSGVGITLGNSRDITIEKITVNRASVTTHAIQFTATCTNILIRDCKLLVSPTTTSSTIAPIYKGGGVGLMDSLFIINNVLNGGHSGFYFVGDNAASTETSPYSKNMIFDSNTVINNYAFGLFVEHAEFLHITGNTLKTRTSNYPSTRWDAFHLHYSNGDVIGNRVINATQEAEYFHLRRFNHYNTTKRTLIANNEVIHLSSSQGSLFMYHDWVESDIHHNSYYTVASNSRGFYFEAVDGSSTFSRNNIFIMKSSSGYFFNVVVGSKFLSNGGYRYDIDYSNFYHSTASYSTLLQGHPSMQNTVSTDVNYVNININTDLTANNTGLNCPILSNVPTDIAGKPRTGQATMGAYQIIPVSRDLSLNQFVTFNPEVVENQTVSLTVEVQNYGNAPLQNAVFGWSLNGQIQTPFPWTPTAPVPFAGQTNVTVGSFTVDNSTTTYNIVVWVDSVNHDLDMDQRKDTLTTVATKKPLVEFVAPFVADTINNLTFEVNAVIRTGSGVSVIPAPQLKLRTVVNGNYTINSSILMTLSNGVWKASVPQQYYGANVVYSITVTDTTGITTTVEDSVYIQYTASSTPYSGHNLTIMNMLTPVNDPNDLCTPNYSLVQAIIRNLGTDNYNFIQNFIALGVEVINPLGTKDSAYIIKNTGTLESGKMDTVLLMPALLVRYPGVYDIKVWVKSSIDNVPYDDTLVYKFVSGRIGLPIDEDFSGSEIPHQFVPVCLVPHGGTNTWEPYTDTTGKILPPSSSNGMLRYAGKRGSMAKLTIRHLDLYRSVDPKMIYWYYYDTTNLDRDNTYTIIRVIMDDVPTVVRTLYKKSSVHGWRADTIDLNPFTNGQCVLIEFESMNGHDLSAQYLGHVTITSIPDLEVSEIIISPKEAVCNLTNRNIQVVLSTVANQAIDFTAIKDTLVVEIGSQPPAYYYYPLTETLEGNASDTFTIAHDVDLTGVSEIKAYLTTPVDNNPSNDIKTYLIDIHPQLELTVLSSTGGVSCFETGIQATQEIILKNTGNIDLTGIELILRLTVGENFTEPVRNPETIDLAVGSSIQYTLKNTYTVPEEDYLVQIFAYVGCDSAGINITNVTNECVDLHNLSMGEIISPLPNKKDTVKTTQTLSVTVINTDKIAPFANVPVRAQIENENGQILNTLIGTVSEIVPSDTVSYTFIEKYTVPEDSLYFIRIFVSSNDLYPKNDTIIAKRETVPADTNNIDIVSIEKLNTFTLEQNIPNPANNMTRIDYNIPEAGRVIFYVHSISGQLLHSQSIEVTRGIHSIELNTNRFSAGVYFYSIEYKGQRLVKRMSVN